MCDACTNLMNRQLETLTVEQRAAVDAYIAHEAQQLVEEAGSEVDEIKGKVEDALVAVEELATAVLESIVCTDTTVQDFPKMLATAATVPDLFQELRKKLDVR